MSNIERFPLLTIAVPTYNGAKTIRCMLDLLLPQCNEQVEVLVSDNCSNDATQEIITGYQKQYPYIKYIRNEKNIGPDANFLQCMQLASGRYIHLLSDDDVMMEGALAKILSYLSKNDEVGLVYLYTKGFRGKYVNAESCSAPAKCPPEDICTTDKKIFMDYAGYYWGFMSSFVISKQHFDRINNPEQFFGTYWLQSYIHILCCNSDETKVGVVSGPCIGAGIYVNVNNFDSSIVDGVNYRKMLNFAIEVGGFDKKQLDDLFKWRIIFLASHSVIKEKAAGIIKTSKINIFKLTWRYPEAWVKLYPTYILPKFICRWIMRVYRKRQSMSKDVSLNREGDTN